MCAVESWLDYAFAIDHAFVSVMFICFACVFCCTCQLMVWYRASEEVKVSDGTSRTETHGNKNVPAVWNYVNNLCKAEHLNQKGCPLAIYTNDTLYHLITRLFNMLFWSAKADQMFTRWQLSFSNEFIFMSVKR